MQFCLRFWIVKRLIKTLGLLFYVHKGEGEKHPVQIHLSFPVKFSLFRLLTENESPQLTGNVSIDATINEEVVIYLNAIDDGPKKPNLIALKQPLGFQLNASTGVAKWKPQNYNVSEIR